MVSAVGCRLLRKGTSGASTPEEALVWAQAARFLGARLQGSADECCGRKADMSAGQAAEMEAAHTLMSNRERVVQDICNPGPNNIDGKKLTQTELKRLDVKYRAMVDAMIRELINSLLGKTMSKPLTPEEAQVWAQA